MDDLKDRHSSQVDDNPNSAEAASPSQPGVQQATTAYADLAPAAAGRAISSRVFTYLSAAQAGGNGRESSQMVDDPLDLFVGDSEGSPYTVSDLTQFYFARSTKIGKFGLRRIAIDRERGTPVSSLHFRSENATSPDVPDFHNSAIAQSAHAVANRRSPKRPTANVASSRLGG